MSGRRVFKNECLVCRLPLTEGKVSFKGDSYHRSCFVCADCGTDLTTTTCVSSRSGKKLFCKHDCAKPSRASEKARRASANLSMSPRATPSRRWSMGLRKKKNDSFKLALSDPLATPKKGVTRQRGGTMPPRRISEHDEVQLRTGGQASREYRPRSMSFEVGEGNSSTSSLPSFSPSSLRRLGHAQQREAPSSSDVESMTSSDSEEFFYRDGHVVRGNEVVDSSDVASVSGRTAFLHRAASLEILEDDTFSPARHSLPPTPRIIRPTQGLTLEQQALFRAATQKVVDRRESGQCAANVQQQVHILLGSPEKWRQPKKLYRTTALSGKELIKSMMLTMRELEPPYPIVLPTDADYHLHEAEADHHLDSVVLYEVVRDDAEYYRHHFVDFDHWNYFAFEEGKPVLVSVRWEDGLFVDEIPPQFRVIVRTSTECVRGVVPESALSDQPDPTEIVTTLCPDHSIDKLWPVIPADEDEEDPSALILKLDEHRLSHCHKFSLAFMQRGQLTEEEILGNDGVSPSFEKFMSLLGTIVKLNGFEGYDGGLDLANAGQESLYTIYEKNEIMFHVSSMLPKAVGATDRMSNRRRLITGNSALIIFQDGDTPFRPETIKSHFLQVFIVVQTVPQDSNRSTASGPTPASEEAAPPQYRVAVFSNPDVSYFGPPLRPGQTFQHGPEFRDWLMRKLLNAGVACQNTPTFRRIAQRTMSAMLSQTTAKFKAIQTIHPPLAVRKASREVSSSSLRSVGSPSFDNMDEAEPATDGSSGSLAGERGPAAAHTTRTRMVRRHSSASQQLAARERSLQRVDRDLEPHRLSVSPNARPGSPRSGSNGTIVHLDSGSFDLRDMDGLPAKEQARTLREYVTALSAEKQVQTERAQRLTQEKEDMMQANLKIRRKIADLKTDNSTLAASLQHAESEILVLRQRVQDLEVELDAPCEV